MFRIAANSATILSRWVIFRPISKVLRETNRENGLPVVARTAVTHQLGVLAALVAPVKDEFKNKAGDSLLAFPCLLSCHPDDIPQPAFDILERVSCGNGLDHLPERGSDDRVMSEACFLGGRGNVHEHAIGNGLGSGVDVDGLAENLGEAVTICGVFIGVHGLIFSLDWWLDEAAFAEGKMGALACDDVIEEPDGKEVCAFFDFGREASIRLARRWVTAWVVVHQNEPVGAGHNRGPEDFPRVRDGLIKTSHRNDVVGSRTQFRINQNRDQVLLVGFKRRFWRDNLLPKSEGLFWLIKRSPTGSVVGEHRLTHPS